MKWDDKTGRGVVMYRGKTLELTACMSNAKLGGKRLDLGSAVTVSPAGPIVPLRKVAEALGMKVKATKTTIEIGQGRRLTEWNRMGPPLCGAAP